MKLDIHCDRGDFDLEVEWPEIEPGVLNYIAFLGLQSGDPGLARLLNHHQTTRIKVGRSEGLSSGHYDYRFKLSGSSEYEKDQYIEVHDTSAVIIHD